MSPLEGLIRSRRASLVTLGPPQGGAVSPPAAARPPSLLLPQLVLSLQQSAEVMDASDEEKSALGEDIRKLRDANVSASEKEMALQIAQDKIAASYAFSKYREICGFHNVSRF